MGRADSRGPLMGDPRVRAQRAQSYLDMLGIGRRSRRRPVVDVEVGEARVEPAPSSEDRALEALAAAEPGRSSVDTSTTRRAEIALAMDHDIPAGWVRGARGETQADANAREERARAEAAAEIERERRRADPGQRTRNMIAAMPEASGRALGELAERPITGPLVQGLTYLPGSFLDDDTLDASLHGTTQGLTLGFADEIVGATTPHNESYQAARDRVRGQRDEAQRDAPWTYGIAEFAGSAPYSALIPSAGPGASLTRRVLTSGGVGAGFGGVTGAGHSRHDYDTPEFRSDIYRDTAIGGAMGAGTELAFAGGRALRDRFRAAPEGTPAPGRDFTPEQQAQIRAARDTDPDTWAMAREREAAEDAAAARRVRSTADSAALSDVRRAGDYHGPGGEGYRGLARDLDETGIMPRRSLGSASDAQLRAARIQEEAGEQLGRVRQRMDDAALDLDSVQLDAPDMIANTPEDLARLEREFLEREAVREASERARREAVRAAGPDATAQTPNRPNRPAPTPSRPSAASRMQWEEADGIPPTEADALATRRQILSARDPALVRYSGDVVTLDDAGRAHQVPAGTAAERLRAEASEATRSATTREQRASAAQVDQLAADMERLGPESYSRAQTRLRALDDEAAYGTRYPNAQGASPERTSRARSARQGVRGDMDLAVERTLGPKALRGAQGARGRYGTARAVEVMSERGAEREAANLQASLGDTMAIHAGLSRNGTLTDRVWSAVEGVVVNRYLRGRGHAAMATLGEMHSDALSREIVRRLAANQATTPASRALAEAARRSPRAFGVALMTLARDNPDVQHEATAAAVELGAIGNIDPRDATGGLGGPASEGAPTPEPMRLEDIDPDDPAGGF